MLTELTAVPLEQLIDIGIRIESDGHFGTVCYTGQVPPTKGSWLGIDWDEPERGKHDGTYAGKKYFDTRYETSGSFLRPQKANLGVSFMTAVRSRYGKVEGGGVVEEELYIRGAKGKTTTVEMVGAEKTNKKQSRLDLLEVVDVERGCVNQFEADVGCCCPRLREVNLSHNLLTTWTQIFEFSRQLTNLQLLNVSCNRLRVADDAAALAAAFPALSTVIANNLLYTWHQVLQCCRMWPGLAELHVCFNSVTSLTDPLAMTSQGVACPTLAHLTTLNLAGNHIVEWRHILQLGNLSNLERLLVPDCGLTSVHFPDCLLDGVTNRHDASAWSTDTFPRLAFLNLSENQISEWPSINELDRLPRLTCLKLRSVPLLTADPVFSEQTLRYLIIAKVGRLRTLNRSEVSAAERRGAELDYLKMFGRAWRAAGGHQDPALNTPSAGFRLQHPRYRAIIEALGAPEDSELASQKTSALKNSLVTLIITCPQRADKPPLSKKLPLTMTVQKLRALVTRLYRADPTTLSVIYTTTKAPGKNFAMDNEFRELSYYSIEDGNEIIVAW